MKNHKRIIELMDELRLSIAEFAQSASDKDCERLGEKLQPLRTDLMELVSGNYDPASMLGE